MTSLAFEAGSVITIQCPACEESHNGFLNCVLSHGYNNYPEGSKIDLIMQCDTAKQVAFFKNDMDDYCLVHSFESTDFRPVTMITVPLEFINGSVSKTVKAVIDTAAQKSYINIMLMRALGLKVRKFIQLTDITGTHIKVGLLDLTVKLRRSLTENICCRHEFYVIPNKKSIGIGPDLMAKLNLHINMPHAPPSTSMLIPLTINRTQYNAILDTGSTSSFISSNIATTLTGDTKIHSNVTISTVFDSNVVDTLASIKVKFIYNNKAYEHYFHINTNNQDQIWIGTDLLTPLGISLV